MVKPILPYPQIKLHNEIYNIAQNCSTKSTTCCTIKFIVKWFFCVCFGFIKQEKNKVYINHFVKSAA